MKNCLICKTENTPQWYTGPLCKACYRKLHRKRNLKIYKERDLKRYQEKGDLLKKQAVERYHKAPELHRERRKLSRLKHSDKRRPDYLKEYVSANREKIYKYQREWVDKNPDKAKAYYTAYNKRNPKYRAYMTAQRRSYKLRATPPWLTKENKDQIAQMYEDCPPGHHVDHILPLKGKTVCGLNVPWNLQYLPASENLSKNNRLRDSENNYPKATEPSIQDPPKSQSLPASDQTDGHQDRARLDL